MRIVKIAKQVLFEFVLVIWSPTEKASIPLWMKSERKRVMIPVVSFWTPKANPSRTEWRDMAMAKVMDFRTPPLFCSSLVTYLTDSSMTILEIQIYVN